MSRSRRPVARLFVSRRPRHVGARESNRHAARLCAASVRCYASFSPPKISDTDVSSKTASMASAMIFATESTSSLSK